AREEQLLDTGGGLKKAAWFFLEPPEEPFLLHNVDVLSSIDPARMAESHRSSRALATLAVEERESSRQLLFDPDGRLCGRRQAGQPPSPGAAALAFSGIHVISPRLLGLIIDTFLRLARAGEQIRAFRSDGCYWRDLGRARDLQEAEADLARLAL